METTDIFLSICITSYNRCIELERTLTSIDIIKYSKNIEIIISEDNSPKKKLIEDIVTSFKKKSKYTVIFNTNESNLGYDRNLEKLISLSNGDYILFISDDDSFVPNSLDQFIDYVTTHEDSLYFQPFVNENNNIKRKYSKSFKKNGGINSCRYIYESILFSGLTFKREKIKDINAVQFVNSNYFQVYLFLEIAFKYGISYVNIILIKCNGDGENGFGISESSEKNVFLANRKSPLSNLEFHKGLIKVIRIFDKNNNTDIHSQFSKEYSKRSIGGLIQAKKYGNSLFLEYQRKIKSLDINLSYIFYFYVFILRFLGFNFTRIFINVIKAIVEKYRTLYKI